MTHKDHGSIDDSYDEWETAIISALLMKGKKGSSTTTKKKTHNINTVRADMGVFCSKSPVFPKNCITFDATDTERLFAGGMAHIVVDPAVAIGGKLEIMFLMGSGQLKWTCIKPMNKPRGLAAITNQKHAWFEIHYRTFDGAGETYTREPFALTASNEVPMLRPMGWSGYDARTERDELEQQLSMALSVFEDAHRAGTYLATVQESVTLSFPVGSEAYKDFFALRDGHKNTPTGRRNPIIHWCGKHVRRTSKQASSPVKKHTRGAVELRHGNIRLSLCESHGYQEFLG